MAEYDPQVLQKFANQLYRRANTAIVGWAIFIFLAVWGLASALFEITRLSEKLDVQGSALLLGAAGALLGLVKGLSRSFNLKLEAQRTLCQLQIEKNTRSFGAAVSTAAASVSAIQPAAATPAAPGHGQ